jgi:hypothetical protein
MRTTITLEPKDPDLEHLKSEIPSIKQMGRLEKEWKRKHLIGALADFEDKTQPEAGEGTVNKYFQGKPEVLNLG